MPETDFETFLRAVGNDPDPDGVLGDEGLVYPPEPDFGYDATPRNALTFGAMGVDGVHYAVLTTAGLVADDSPVISIGPMDFSEPYVVLGESFRSYLAAACGVPEAEMAAAFAAERAGETGLVAFLKDRYRHSRLYEGGRHTRLASLLGRVVPKA